MDTDPAPHEAAPAPAAGAEPSGVQQHLLGRPASLTKSRSLSDGGGTTPKLSPSPHIVVSARRTSKDDHDIDDLCSSSSFPNTGAAAVAANLAGLPSTPKRSEVRGLSSLHIQQQQQPQPPRTSTPPPAAVGSTAFGKPAPLSPKLDHSHIYASPTNILPRRSRGLDFSRAATSLHHSTLAESSPESSPTVGGRGMNIPARRREFGLGAEHSLQSSASVWPAPTGNPERMTISSSLGSTQAVGSESSSSSEDDDLMDEDMDEAYVTTPQVSRSGPGGGNPFGSPAIGPLASFQNRQRPRKHPKKKVRGPLGLGFNINSSALSRSPPNNSSRARRESISWQANQLHISSGDGEDSGKSDVDGPSADAQPSVTRRAVTRRGNLLPKTKTFARIRAALLEEGAPAEAEFRREAEVVKQVRESDVEQEARPATNVFDLSQAVSALSSPNMVNQDTIDEPEEDLMRDLSTGLSSSFKQQMLKTKSKSFWDTFSECSSTGGGGRASPPPQPFVPRESSSGMSEDAGMDSPSFPLFQSYQQSQATAIGPQPPSAAEITRRINNKRRRDDDLDPVSFKRRAVSPGMSVHNSPVVQSPMQRDNVHWSSGSRPGSTGGERAGSSAQSDSGSMGGGNTSGTPSGSRVSGNKGRVGFQGMVDANDAIMRMSIE
ncbi:hypothetical protein LMH87_010978 [Akanthomyces muscarius]|uniref:Uncharacterized protein n=1 Tax=Akanthomyces muscarius TaxID=2231603 RepID=A0A9W8Q925_AKAMU|nr:hypothetical protein LMH87_010978 [Akanthomyces muscarius]KAJ4150219.1 hypothetical protein LMH87_010978 [Akanthomyces muscarius]